MGSHFCGRGVLVADWPSCGFTVLLGTAALSLALAGGREATAAGMDRTGTLWSPHLEWSLNNDTFDGNPFDLAGTVTFEHQESGATHTTEMFYDGGTTWKFRFTGTRIGVWTFATSSGDSDLDGHYGTVTIDPNPDPNAYGFMTQYEAADGTKWARFKGNEGAVEAFVPQLVMYETDPSSYFNNPTLLQTDIQEFILDHGFNGFHIPFVGGNWFDLDADTEVHSGMQDPDPRTFEAIELAIAETYAAGAVVHLWAWGDHQRFWTCRSLADGINGIQDRRLQRYIAARLGPLPGWSMGYGFDLHEWVSASQLKDWRHYRSIQ